MGTKKEVGADNSQVVKFSGNGSRLLPDDGHFYQL